MRTRLGPGALSATVAASNASSCEYRENRTDDRVLSSTTVVGNCATNRHSGMCGRGLGERLALLRPAARSTALFRATLIPPTRSGRPRRKRRSRRNGAASREHTEPLAETANLAQPVSCPIKSNNGSNVYPAFTREHDVFVLRMPASSPAADHPFPRSRPTANAPTFLSRVFSGFPR